MKCDVNKSSSATTDGMQVCSSLHLVRVYVHRVVHVIIHNVLNIGESVLGVVHTCSVAICHIYLFVNFWFRMYCIYTPRR